MTTHSHSSIEVGTINSLRRFIVKSCAPEALLTARLGRRGIEHDRRWMLTDPSGRFVTGRLIPQITLLKVQMVDKALRLEFDGQQCIVPVPGTAGHAREVTVWRDEVAATDVGDTVAGWLTERLGRELRLVYQHDDQHRLLREEKSFRQGDEVGFADGYPLLIIGTASLSDLNLRLQSPVTMDRFRPNLIVETENPFEEDEWDVIQIGDVRIKLATRCARCIFTTVDPLTGKRDVMRQPLEALRGYRTDADTGEIYFGRNAIPITEGTLTVGDPVYRI